MGEKLPSCICYFLVFEVILDGPLKKFGVGLLGQILVVDPNTVVGQSLSVLIPDQTTDVQKLLVESYGLTVLAKVIA